MIINRKNIFKLKLKLWNDATLLSLFFSCDQDWTQPRKLFHWHSNAMFHCVVVMWFLSLGFCAARLKLLSHSLQSRQGGVKNLSNACRSWHSPLMQL